VPAGLDRLQAGRLTSPAAPVRIERGAVAQRDSSSAPQLRRPAPVPCGVGGLQLLLPSHLSSRVPPPGSGAHWSAVGPSNRLASSPQLGAAVNLASSVSQHLPLERHKRRPPTLPFQRSVGIGLVATCSLACSPLLSPISASRSSMAASPRSSTAEPEPGSQKANLRCPLWPRPCTPHLPSIREARRSRKPSLPANP